MSVTPGSRLRAFSTLIAQALQSMPSTRILSTSAEASAGSLGTGNLEFLDMTFYMDPVATTGSIPWQPNN